MNAPIDKNKESAQRTLALSFLIGFPGPVILGISLFSGMNYTVFAEFVRKMLVSVSIAFSYCIFRISNRRAFPLAKKQRYEYICNISVGIVMILSGLVFVAVVFLSDTADSGNVIVGLIVAALSAMLNVIIYLRSVKLSDHGRESILVAQSKMNLARLLLDCCVCIVYIVILLSPDTSAAHYVDLIGSFIVSLVTVLGGCRLIRSEMQKRGSTDEQQA